MNIHILQSTALYESNVLKYNVFHFFSGELDLIQKKAFTKWVNSHLEKVRKSDNIINLYYLVHDKWEQC